MSTRPNLRRARPEQEIQRAVFQHLTIRAAPGTYAFHPANGGWRSRVEGAILTGMGVRAGVPDIIAVKGGRCCALELKAAGGRLTSVQRDAHAALVAAGATVAVAYGLDETRPAGGLGTGARLVPRTLRHQGLERAGPCAPRRPKALRRTGSRARTHRRASLRT